MPFFILYNKRWIGILIPSGLFGQQVRIGTNKAHTYRY